MSEKFRYISMAPGLIDGKHIHRMGMSVWLYIFLVDRQTDRSGLVNYGKPITYSWIASQIQRCPSVRTLRFWMSTLRINGYVWIDYAVFGHAMTIRIAEAKKWPSKKLDEACAKACEKVSENLLNCGKSTRQDLAESCGRILPSGPYIEEKGKETVKGLQTNLFPVHNAVQRIAQQKKIS